MWTSIVLGLIFIIIAIILGACKVDAVATIILVMLGIATLITSRTFSKKRKVLLNMVIKMKTIDANSSKVDGEEVANENDEEQQLGQIESQVNEEKSGEELRKKRKEDADRLVGIHKKNTIYMSIFFGLIGVFALLILFAPVCDLEIIKVSMFDLMRDELLLEAFRAESTFNNISYYMFIVGLVVGGVFIIMSIALLASLSYQIQKIRDGIETPQKQMIFTDLRYATPVYSGVSYVIMGILGFTLIYVLFFGLLVCMPTSFVLLNKELINWAVVIIDLVIMIIDLIVCIA